MRILLNCAILLQMKCILSKSVQFICSNFCPSLTMYPYAEQICGLGDEMRRNLVLSLELGFTTLSVDAVFVLCSDFVQVCIVKRV